MRTSKVTEEVGQRPTKTTTDTNSHRRNFGAQPSGAQRVHGLTGGTFNEDHGSRKSEESLTTRSGRSGLLSCFLLSVGMRKFRIIIELCPFGVYLAILFFLQFHQVIFLPDLDIVAKTSIKILKSQN